MNRNHWEIIDNTTGDKQVFLDTEVQYVAHETINEKDYIVVCTDIDNGIKYYFNADEWEAKYCDENGHEIGELD